jgi:hypothetical protein
MSFLTLVTSGLGSSIRDLTWIHLVTSFRIEFARYRSALLAYRAEIVLLGGILYLSCGCKMQAR